MARLGRFLFVVAVIAAFAVSNTGAGGASVVRVATGLEQPVYVTAPPGDTSRLFIVEELARGERCVCELQKMIGADMSTVSKHLAQLRSAGVVRDEKRGAQVF